MGETNMKELYEYQELTEKMNRIVQKGWIKSVNNGDSGVGLTLENELGIHSEDFEIPDYGAIEIKAKKTNSEPYITLFGAAPDSYLYEIKRIHKEYGYPHSKYPQYKVFNISIYGNKYVQTAKKYQYILYVDWHKEKVFMHVFDKLSGILIDNKCSWSFDMIKEKVYRKLKYLLFVKANRKYECGSVYYKYYDYIFYELKEFKSFLKAIDDGTVKITFKINVFKSGKKAGQIHDHGTSFDIMEQDLEKIYNKIL